MFKSVSELVAAPTTPKLVKVIECPSSPTKGPLLERHDILVVRKAGKTMLRKPFMKVYSLRAKEEKTLYVSGRGLCGGCEERYPSSFHASICFLSSIIIVGG